MFRHLINLYVASFVYKQGMAKVEAKGELGEEAEQHFNVNADQMKLAGYLETVGSVLIGLSIFSKTLSRIGALMITAVLSVAALKHFLAGDKFSDASNAIKYGSLSLLSFIGSFKK